MIKDHKVDHKAQSETIEGGIENILVSTYLNTQYWAYQLQMIDANIIPDNSTWLQVLMKSLLVGNMDVIQLRIHSIYYTKINSNSFDSV